MGLRDKLLSWLLLLLPWFLLLANIGIVLLLLVSIYGIFYVPMDNTYKFFTYVTFAGTFFAAVVGLILIKMNKWGSETMAMTAWKKTYSTFKPVSIGLIYLIILSLTYSFLLFSFKPLFETLYYPLLTIPYHLLLLAIPLYLIFTRKEARDEMGITKGDFKQGITWTVLLIIVLVASIFVKAILYKRQIIFSIDLSLIGVLLALTYFVLAPISEEFFHRGYIQSKILGRKGVIISSVIFALNHIPKMAYAPEYLLHTSSALPPLAFSLPTSTNSLLFAFLWFFGIGLYLGELRISTKSVWYSVLSHSLANILLITFLLGG